MSGEFEVVRSGDAGIRVSGRIDVDNAASALAEGLPLVSASRCLEVDLENLASADSVTLAVLLAWSARAQRNGGELVYRKIPQRLRSIAHLSDAETLLGIDS